LRGDLEILPRFADTFDIVKAQSTTTTSRKILEKFMVQWLSQLICAENKNKAWINTEEGKGLSDSMQEVVPCGKTHGFKIKKN
jgi:hypothetical protein